MKLKSPALLAYFCALFAQASDITDACFNCPPLDKVADATTFDDATYYAEALAAISNNLSATELKARINAAISQNQKTLTYSEVWTALTQTDEDPNNHDNVILLYSGKSIAKMSNGSGTQSSNPDNWNREHVWAKSHGFPSDSFEAYTDINHLRAADISINASRGNLDFDNSDAPLAEDPKNRIDSDSFEPRDAVKGDVARMVFYMDTRYEGADVTPDLQVVDHLTSTSDAALGRLCRLLEWNAQDPVDDAERTRNSRIYEFQGNRNPFIDHPEWVDKLYQAASCSGDAGTGGDTTPPDNGGDTGGTTPDNGGDTGGTTSNGATLFISEYVEGSSYNKALELFNPGNSSIDLAAENYQLGRFSNGGTNPAMIDLTGTIEAKGTFVIAEGRADAAILAVANQTTSALSHNGDDAYVLYKDGVAVDSFGRVGEDPGSAWGSDTTTTKDNTLRRINTVLTGDAIFDDEFDPAVQWQGFGKDNFADLGQHSVINPELFISEYIEGSSYNKALELYNPGINDIDLGAENYQLGLFANGKTTPSMINLTGVISAKDVFVIANTGAASDVLAVADQTTGSLSHNGDDAYVLYKNGEVIDSFGRVGEDPGSAWGSGTSSTKDNTLVRKATVNSGDTIIDDAFDPSIEWEGHGNNVFDFLGSHVAGAEEPVSALGQCYDPATLISAIQGNGFSSPVVGETHVVEGVVTAAFDSLSGFFLQEEAADEDGDAATSEAIFVSVSSGALPQAGSVVRVIGTVAESYGKTQLNSSEQVLDCGTGSVNAQALSLPFASNEQQEALEGMLVSSATALTVTDNYNLGRYGEVTLSNGRVFVPTNIFAPGSDEMFALAESNKLNRVLLDDGINGQNPADIIYPNGGLSADNSLRTGDTVSNLTGVLDYSFGEYRVIPTAYPDFVHDNARENTPNLSSGNLRVASFNVLNYFNGDGLGNGFPTARGASSAQEFERQRAKTINAITSMHADIIGLLEMENDGYGEHSAIQDLINGLNAVAGSDSHYSFVNPGVDQLGTDLIKVALIYNDKAVSEVGTAAYLTDFPFEYHNRVPLAQTFRSSKTGERLTVAINHFRSKGCSSTGGVENADQHDGQGCYNLRRVQAAQATTAWLAQHPTGSDDDDILLLGDLNSYSKEDPVTTLEQAGYTELAKKFIGDSAYSYGYAGEVGTLDHALASKALTDKVVDVTEWHINTDEPKVLDYNMEYKNSDQLITLYSDEPFRASDHDPVVVEIQGVTPLIPVTESYENLGTNARWSTFEFDVPATSVSFTATISGGEGNADLYVSQGKKPNTQKFDCRPMLAGNEESCVMDNPTPGKWYIRLRGERSYSNVTLKLEALYPEPINP